MVRVREVRSESTLLPPKRAVRRTRLATRERKRRITLYSQFIESGGAAGRGRAAARAGAERDGARAALGGRDGGRAAQCAGDAEGVGRPAVAARAGRQRELRRSEAAHGDGADDARRLVRAVDGDRDQRVAADVAAARPERARRTARAATSHSRRSSSKNCTRARPRSSAALTDSVRRRCWPTGWRRRPGRSRRSRAAGRRTRRRAWPEWRRSRTWARRCRPCPPPRCPFPAPQMIVSGVPSRPRSVSSRGPPSSTSLPSPPVMSPRPSVTRQVVRARRRR